MLVCILMLIWILASLALRVLHEESQHQIEHLEQLTEYWIRLNVYRGWEIKLLVQIGALSLMKYLPFSMT